jgi:hypothetical protein
MNTRFTLDGSDALEAQLGDLCARVAEGVRQIVPTGKLHALVLGGGYGRGEGGVLRSESGEQPYNDLEFYVLYRGSALSALRYKKTIHHLAEELTRSGQIEVELKLLPLEKLISSPASMFVPVCSSRKTVYPERTLAMRTPISSAETWRKQSSASATFFSPCAASIIGAAASVTNV